MDLIAPPGPRAGRWVVVLNGKDRGSSAIVKARRHARAVRRRRRFLILLVLGALGTLAAALMREGRWWEIHAAVDAVFVLYVGVLLEAKKRRAEQLTKVRTLNRRTRHRDDYQIAVGGER
jgi:hypothetical protein